MKKLLYLACMLPLLLQGCGGSSSRGANSTLTTFLSLHDKYCSANYVSSEQLVSLLEGDPALHTNGEHDGIFETTISDVSYAISPEETGCTTDVKIKKAPWDRIRFSFEEIDQALVYKGYKPAGSKIYRSEIGIDNEELKVLEQKYIAPDDTISTLVFPLEREDKYYMTFYTEKSHTDGVYLRNSAGLIEI